MDPTNKSDMPFKATGDNAAFICAEFCFLPYFSSYYPLSVSLNKNTI